MAKSEKPGSLFAVRCWLFASRFCATSSCEKESALWADSIPAIEQENMANQDAAPLDFRRSTDTTLQLTAKHSTLDTSANTYTVTFDRDYTGDVQSLSAQQHLAFSDEQQQAQQVAMQPQSFTQTSTDFEVVFDYGSALLLEELRIPFYKTTLQVDGGDGYGADVAK